jgi:hypothetical protein
MFRAKTRDAPMAFPMGLSFNRRQLQIYGNRKCDFTNTPNNLILSHFNPVLTLIRFYSYAHDFSSQVVLPSCFLLHSNRVCVFSTIPRCSKHLVQLANTIRPTPQPTPGQRKLSDGSINLHLHQQ